jgi:AcrR family transcriptional regulator
MQAAPGLRQRKRTATFQALSRAAIDLALEAGGVDDLTIDAIADRANVSRRTFFNYFPSKEACFTWPLASLATRYLGEIQRQPESEAVWDVLQRAAEAAIADPHTDLALLGASERVLSVSPSLIALLTSDARAVSALQLMRERFAAEITRRSRTDIATDVYPQLMIECAGIGLRLATRRAAALGGDPTQHVAEVFGLLRAGVPQPRPQVESVPCKR